MIKGLYCIGEPTFKEMQKTFDNKVSMCRFSDFKDEELNAMESAFCSEGLKSLVEEVRQERHLREEAHNAKTCSNCGNNPDDVPYSHTNSIYLKYCKFCDNKSKWCPIDR